MTRTKISSFEDLEIWQRGVKLTEEIYGLSSQLRRAAVSIPSNIAEGFARFFVKEYIQFLYVAIGSCAEVSTQITIADRLGYLKQEKANLLLDEVEQISKMIMGLIKKLKTKAKNPNNYRLTTNSPPSSSGLGRRVLNPVTGVRLPLGVFFIVD